IQRWRVRSGVGRQQGGNEEKRSGKQGETGRDATERGCHRNYAITKVYIFVPKQRLTGSFSTILKFVGLCNFLAAALMPKLAWTLAYKLPAPKDGELAMKWMFMAAFGFALAVSSTASAQRPDRYVDPPIVRSFNWFAFVGGDEIRANCGNDGGKP